MRVIRPRDGTWTAEDAATEEAAAAAGDGLTWIRAGGVPTEELDALGKRLGLHPLALEDVRSPRQRPKVEDYDDTTFVVVRIPRGSSEDGPAWQQVGLFLGATWVVTASEDPVPELDAAEARLCKRGLAAERSTSAHLLHLVLDHIVDAWFPVMDDMEDLIEELEDEAGQRPHQAVLRRIRGMKQVVSRTRKVSQPMRDAMLSLERGDHPHLHDEARVYLRDVSDHMVRLSERLDHVKEMALIAQETWNSALANQQNQVMKRLTVIAGLLLAPSLAAGLGGMNFPGFPEWDYWTVTWSILAFVVVGLAVALWRRWL